MDKPPPINILYQDPRDTTTLLKSKLKDLDNFYIKHINSGKISLQVDTLENYKQVKQLLSKCNSKFYLYFQIRKTDNNIIERIRLFISRKRGVRRITIPEHHKRKFHKSNKIYNKQIKAK